MQYKKKLTIKILEHMTVVQRLSRLDNEPTECLALLIVTSQLPSNIRIAFRILITNRSEIQYSLDKGRCHRNDCFPLSDPSSILSP